MDVTKIDTYTQSEMANGPFGIEATKFTFPTVVAPRIAAQKGLFSVHATPDKPWRLPNLTDRIDIQADDKEDFLEILFGLGVDAAIVMADLDGISTNLAWRYKTGKPMI